MKRLYGNISPADRAICERPKVLKSICVNFPSHILNGMVNNLMSVFFLKAVVRKQSIGVQVRTRFNVGLDFFLQSILATIRNNYGMHLAMLLAVFRLAVVATLKHSEDSGFILRASAGDSAFLDIHVHVSGFSTDE